MKLGWLPSGKNKNLSDDYKTRERVQGVDTRITKDGCDFQVNVREDGGTIFGVDSKPLLSFRFEANGGIIIIDLRTALTNRRNNGGEWQL